jgi:hypothetical protein
MGQADEQPAGRQGVRKIGGNISELNTHRMGNSNRFGRRNEQAVVGICIVADGTL